MIIEKWKQSEAYVIGTSHIAMNEPCQDRTFYVKENGIHVIALADGAGSRKFSHKGAEIVTKTICQLLNKEFFKIYMHCEKRGKAEAEYQDEMKKLKRYILKEILTALNHYATQEGLLLDDLSSTLLFCAIHNNKYIIGHIGDGVIGGLFEENNELTIKTLSVPKNDGAPNITFFLTDSNALDHLRISTGEFTNCRGIILMSDGPGEVMYDETQGMNKNVIKIFDNYHKTPPAEYHQILKRFLSESISKYSNDDLSLNLLYLESLNSKTKDHYTMNLLKDITSKHQIVYKSNYCVHLEPTIKSKKIDFLSVEDVRSYLKWT